MSQLVLQNWYNFPGDLFPGVVLDIAGFCLHCPAEWSKGCCYHGTGQQKLFQELLSILHLQANTGPFPSLFHLCLQGLNLLWMSDLYFFIGSVYENIYFLYIYFMKIYIVPEK